MRRCWSKNRARSAGAVNQATPSQVGGNLPQHAQVFLAPPVEVAGGRSSASSPSCHSPEHTGKHSNFSGCQTAELGAKIHPRRFHGDDSNRRGACRNHEMNLAPFSWTNNG